MTIVHARTRPSATPIGMARPAPASSPVASVPPSREALEPLGPDASVAELEAQEDRAQAALEDAQAEVERARERFDSSGLAEDRRALLSALLAADEAELDLDRARRLVVGAQERDRRALLAELREEYSATEAELAAAKSREDELAMAEALARKAVAEARLARQRNAAAIEECERTLDGLHGRHRRALGDADPEPRRGSSIYGWNIDRRPPGHGHVARLVHELADELADNDPLRPILARQAPPDREEW